MTIYHTTDLDPKTFHERRRLMDAGLLAGVSNEVRGALMRVLCPCCRYGMAKTTRSTEFGPITEHHPDNLHSYPCKAAEFHDEFFALVNFWESTQEAADVKS